MERRYEYERPPQEDDLLHKIHLEVEGKRVGEAKLEYRNSPFPFYYLDLIYIDSHEHGQGHGRELLDQVNAFLETKGKPGLLVNAIDDDDPAHGMYSRHGWSQVPNHEDWFGYKLEGINSRQIEQAIYAINAREDRKEKPKAA